MKLKPKQTPTPISEKMRKLNLTTNLTDDDKKPPLSPNTFELQVVESLDGDLLDLLKEFD